MKQIYSKKTLILSLILLLIFCIITIMYVLPGFKIIIANHNKIIEDAAIQKIEIIDWNNYLAIILFLFIIFSTLLLSLFLYVDFKNDFIGVYKLLFGIFFVGVFIPIIYFFHYLSKFKFIKLKKITKKFLMSFLLFPTIGLSISPFFAMEIYEDKPSKNYDILLSVDPQKPNIIFLFVDGFSAERIQKYNLENKIKQTFKNFVYFKHSASHGFLTQWGEPALFSGLSQLYLDPLIKRKKPLHELFKNYNKIKNTYIDQSYLINPEGVGGKYAGDPVRAEKIFKDFNVKAINWSRAREEAFKHKEIFNHHYINDIKYMGWKAKMSTKKQNASFIMLYDESLHYLHNMNNEGHVIPFGTELNEYNATLNALNFTFNKWKKIEKNGITAFDNSIIVAVGDHGSHESITPNNNNPGQRGMTATFIKFPNYHRDLKIIENRTLWTPFLYKIIKGYFETNKYKNEKAFIDWINKNKNFNPKIPRLLTFGENAFGNNKEKIASSLVTFDKHMLKQNYYQLDHKNIFYVYDEYRKKDMRKKLINFSQWKGY